MIKRNENEYTLFIIQIRPQTTFLQTFFFGAVCSFVLLCLPHRLDTQRNILAFFVHNLCGNN